MTCSDADRAVGWRDSVAMRLPDKALFLPEPTGRDDRWPLGREKLPLRSHAPTMIRAQQLQSVADRIVERASFGIHQVLPSRVVAERLMAETGGSPDIDAQAQGTPNAARAEGLEPLLLKTARR
jgi:hypothetical protein